MIDESVLAELLQEAADGIEIPPSGPEGVLAARDRLPPASRWPTHLAHGDRRRPRARRWSSETTVRVVSVAAAVLVIALIGVGVALSAHGGSSMTSATTTVAGSAAGSATGSATGAASSAGAVHNAIAQQGRSAGNGGLPPEAAGGSANNPSGSVAPLPTQVIKTGSLSLVVRVGTVQSTVTRLTSLAAGLGGYVQDSQSTTTASPTASMTLRVPVANFDQLTAQAQTYGKVTSFTTAGQDVTAQSVDLAARIQALQASIAQYLEILTKAETISDILAVQQQIDSLQDQLSQLQGQQKVLNDQTSFSTLSVTITQPAAPAKLPPPPPRQRSGLSAAWAHARRSFTHGIESVLSASGGIAVFLICTGILVGLGWVGWRVARRRLI